MCFFLILIYFPHFFLSFLPRLQAQASRHDDAPPPTHLIPPAFFHFHTKLTDHWITG